MPLRILLTQGLQALAGTEGDNAVCQQRVCTGSFSLSDSKACTRCTSSSDCNQETLLIESKEDISVVDFEDFVGQSKRFSSLFVGGVCDYLLYSEGTTQIAFCDLTCSESKYVNANAGKYPEGKRMKAFSQMQNSLMTLLTADSLIGLKMLSASRKRLIFGWREPEFRATDIAEESMMEFGITPSSDESVLTSMQHRAGYDFEFVQVKYPTPYVWDFDI